MADSFEFFDEDLNLDEVVLKKPWKVLIVDDDQSIHDITTHVLSGFEFENRQLEFLHAFTSIEGQQKLKEHKDIVLIFLDVVMEKENAGLELVKYIRETLKNTLVRIVLRTGQPGSAPEREVICNYDINDYKEKAELTNIKLMTSVISSLRAYKLIHSLEKNRQGLDAIIESSKELLKYNSMADFSKEVFRQLISLLAQNEFSEHYDVQGLLAEKDGDSFMIQSASDAYEQYLGNALEKQLPEDITQLLDKVHTEKQNVFHGTEFVGYMSSEDNAVEKLLYLNGIQTQPELDKEIIDVFMSSTTVTMDNIYLNNKILDDSKEVIQVQQEILLRLNKVIGMRSKETEGHVQRVAHNCSLIATSYGLSSEEGQMLKMVAPIHDIGKVGIPDAILLKPGKLTPEEYETMKFHAELGEKMLYNNNSDILQNAAVVAGYHHEKWDGTGYPHGLKGDAIPLYGRILAVADVFDALMSKRPYKEKWDLDTSLTEIKKGSGTHFDPDVVSAFLDCIDDILEIYEAFPEG